jgi:site-specific DNA-methyltransferase (adenine-specific)
MSAAAEMVDPATLRPWPKNPRKNDGEPVAKVAESIKRFGFAAPIVARLETREIIAGHTRWKAATQLGLTEVPVRFLDLDEHEAHLLALADNRLGELAEWDTPELHALLESYTADDLTDAGWDESIPPHELGELEQDEPKVNNTLKDEGRCPNCGRYMARKTKKGPKGTPGMT